jgi:hypothetical protein
MAELWRIEDHCCRACLGRVVSRTADDGRTITRCSSCSAESVGTYREICCCGVVRGNYNRLRCFKIEPRPPGVAAEIVVSEIDESGNR